MILVSSLLISVSACQSESTTDNLINKVNSIDDTWINYEGEQENDNTMVQSQFIPYHPKKDYEENYPTYIAYYEEAQLLETIRYQETPATLAPGEEADGVIVSYNKKNKNGMKMVERDEQ